MVPQVQVISILMIVNGVLQSLLGLLLAGLGPTMFVLISKEKGPRPPHPDEQTFLTLISGVYLLLGILVLTAGILNIIAGIRCLKFRGRVFAIVALFFNIIPTITCYCAPTSIGLLVYGLIVLFNSEVARAFRMAAEGVPPAEIQAHFSGRRWKGDWEDDDWEEDRPDRR
jgi:hypothetical protein